MGARGVRSTHAIAIAPALVLMTLAWLPPLRAKEFSEQFSEVVPFVEAGKVEISTFGGSVVFSATEAGEVKIEATKTVEADNEEEGKKKLGALEIDVRRSANTLRIETIFPREGSFLGRLLERGAGKSVRVDYRIFVPTKTDLHIDGTSTDVQGSAVEGRVSLDLTSGNSDLSDIKGDVLLDGTSGDLKITKVTGDLLVDNTSGHVTATDIGGDVEIDKTSGAITLAQVGGDLFLDGTSCDVEAQAVGGDAEIDLTSGDVMIVGLRGGIRHEGTSGDLHIEFEERLEESCTIATISGDVELVVPEGSKMSLDLQTLSGGISAKISHMEISEVSNNTLKAIVAGGGPIVSVETTSGSIRIMGK